MIRSCSLCARGVMARGSRYRLVGNSLAHNADGAKIMTSYQVISTRRQSRFVKKPKSKVRKKVDINTLFKPMSVSFPEEGAGAGIEIAGPMKEGMCTRVPDNPTNYQITPRLFDTFPVCPNCP